MKTTILVVTNDKTALHEVEKAFHTDSKWEVIGAASAEESIERSHHHPIDVVLLSEQTEEQDKRKLRAIVKRQYPDLSFFSFNMKDVGDLLRRVNTELDRKTAAKKPTIQIMDDALPKGGLPIHEE